MVDFQHAAQARRLYLHVKNGGQAKTSDIERLVRVIEDLEQRLADALPTPHPETQEVKSHDE